MRHQQEFNIRITISDPIAAAIDLDKYILDYIKQVYENRCYRGFLIISVLNIIKRSKLTALSNILDGSANVNVHFNAEVITYLENEIIVGCRIKIKKEISIMCETPTARIALKTNERLNSFTVGQLITLVVQKAVLTTNDDVASISALPYFPDGRQIIYKPTVDPLRKDFISFIINEIETILTSIKSLSEKQVESYKLFVNSTSLVDNVPDMKYEEPHVDIYKLVRDNIDNLDSIKEKLMPYVVINHKVSNPIDPIVFVPKSIESVELKKAIIPIYLSNMVESILCDYREHIKMIREMLMVYNSSEIVNAHKNYWLFFKSFRKSPMQQKSLFMPTLLTYK